jgi:hypothetical protein
MNQSCPLRISISGRSAPVGERKYPTATQGAGDRHETDTSAPFATSAGPATGCEAHPAADAPALQ